MLAGGPEERSFVLGGRGRRAAAGVSSGRRAPGRALTPLCTRAGRPSQLEFFAEEEPITIIPSFQLRHNTTGMLSCIGVSAPQRGPSCHRARWECASGPQVLPVKTAHSCAAPLNTESRVITGRSGPTCRSRSPSGLRCSCTSAASAASSRPRGWTWRACKVRAEQRGADAACARY